MKGTYKNSWTRENITKIEESVGGFSHKREKLYMEDQPVENTQNEPLRDKMVESTEMG